MPSTFMPRSPVMFQPSGHLTNRADGAHPVIRAGERLSQPGRVAD